MSRTTPSTNWMRELAEHFHKMRQARPADRLLILFDIDGTILDMRHTILHVLQAYDEAHQTRHFAGLKLSGIKVHENHVERLLDSVGVPPGQQGAVMKWFHERRWSPEAIAASHLPYRGVLDVIRWFQIQPDTFVGLNTGRPESIRADTLRSLNALGEEFGVRFDDALLHMNPHDWDVEVADGKAAGITRFRRDGYRVIAFLDNEPENLRAVGRIDDSGEIILLHANTLYESRRSRVPTSSAVGSNYDLTELITEGDLPPQIQLVWHGVNTEANLRQFLGSNIQWAELDARRDPKTGHLITRHDSFAERTRTSREKNPSLEHMLQKLHKHGRSVKFDFKEGGVVIDQVLDLIATCGFSDEQLWFNGNVERLGQVGFQQLAQKHPKAILQCPVDYMAALALGVPAKARETLELYRSWGMNRFSVSWRTTLMRPLIAHLGEWGFAVNIYDVPDLESFLRAVLLLPRSITSDFNFPKWHYYGHGSGEKDETIEYVMRQQRGAPKR